MGELVKQQSEHISQEVELVKAELEPKVAHVETDLELLKQLPDHIRQVVHDEVELVRAELEAKVKRVEIGLGMFAGAGAIAFYALGVLVAAAVLGLATAVTAWLSAVIVAVALVAIAGLLALGGNLKMHESSHGQPSCTHAPACTEVRRQPRAATSGVSVPTALTNSTLLCLVTRCGGLGVAEAGQC